MSSDRIEIIDKDLSGTPPPYSYMDTLLRNMIKKEIDLIHHLSYIS